MLEFVGLEAKLYSYKTLDNNETKKFKGINKSVDDNTISFEDYKKCLFDRSEKMRIMNVIRSHRHKIYTEEINKIAVSSKDDKCVITEDTVTIHYIVNNNHVIWNKYNVKIKVEGVVLSNKLLTNFEMLSVANNCEYQISVVYSNEIFYLKIIKERWYINLEYLLEYGSHWMAWFKTNHKTYYFHSFGVQPPLELIDYLKPPIYYNT